MRQAHPLHGQTPPAVTPPPTVTPPVSATPDKTVTIPAIIPATISGDVARAPQGGMIDYVAPEFTYRIPGSVCGPDITDNVFAAMRSMKIMFDANLTKQEDACRSLIDPQTGGWAWDIEHMAPATEGTFFTVFAPNICSIPKPECAASVEFLGTCYHTQIVNYVQWGMMTALCGGSYPEVGAALHRVRNIFTGPLSAPTQAQMRMADVGAEYKKLLEQKPDGPDLSALREDHIAKSKFIARAHLACSLSCPITPSGKNLLKEWILKFKWVGLTPPSKDDARYDGRTGR